MSKPETKSETKQKGMCIATRCTSVEQFIQMFHRFVDEESFFVSTHNTRPPGLETSFSVQLADGTPVLRGLCVVRESYATNANPFKTPGVRLGIKRLTANSTAVFEQLLASKREAASKPRTTPPPLPISPSVVLAKSTPIPSPAVRTETAPQRLNPSRVELKHPARPPTPLPVDIKPLPVESKPVGRAPTPLPIELKPVGRAPTPLPIDIKPMGRAPTPLPIEPEQSTDVISNEPTAVKSSPKIVIDAKQLAEPAADLPTPVADDERTPGSDLVLPANPLTDLTDESLDGYVECTLYEETGNFFPAEDDESGAPLGDVIEPPPPVLPANPLSFEAPPALRTEPRDPVSEHDETTPVPIRPSAPSMPPELLMPRESVPVVTARGSQPVVPDEPEIHVAKRRSSGVWWLLASLVVLAGAAAVFVMYGLPKTETPAPAKRPVEARAQVPAERPTNAAANPDVAKPEADKPAEAKPEAPDVGKPDAEKPAAGKPDAEKPAVAAPPDDEDEAPPPPPGNGPPVVGDGPCRVIVTSTPAGSTIAVDDKVIAPSPITVATTCDAHKIDIAHARYQATTRNVTLAHGKQQTLDVTLTRPTHSVNVKSDPPGATIFINGRRAGTTPSVINVLGWESMTLEIKKIGYQPVSQRLYSRAVNDAVAVRLVKW